MAMMKFKEEVLEDLKKIFENEELETINTLLEGKAKSNTTKNAHLETYRKMITVLSKGLNWNVSEENSENVTDDRDDTISVDQEEFNAMKADYIENEDQNKSVPASEVHGKKETCKALKSGKCQHGWTGKKPDHQGKICPYMHPKACKKHERLGRCYDNRCQKLHFNLCRDYMNTMECKYREECKFFHPTGLKDFDMEHERRKPYLRQGSPTGWKDPNREQGKNKSYFRQRNQMQHPFSDQNQGQNVQGPFLEQTFLEQILRRLDRIEMQNSQPQGPQKMW